MSSMDKCYWLHNDGGCYQQLCNDSGKTVHVGRCPFADALSGQISYCDMFIPDDVPNERTSAFEKRASWADVAAKGRDIVATGGVRIIEENSEQIEAVVTSYQVAGAFPVYQGGPYDVILSKKSWENSGNVGGWIQGYLCSCEWGKYNSGQPGPGWRGRFCAHAYATLLESNARARKDFMGERTASMRTYGTCEVCGEYTDVDVKTGMCESCHGKTVFESIVSAAWSSDKRTAAKAEAFLVESVDNSEISAVCDEIEMRDIDERTALACWNGYRALVSKCAYGDFILWDEDGYEASCELPDGSSCDVFENSDGEYVWELYSPHGEYVDSERGYDSLEDAKSGFEKKVGVQRMSGRAKRVAASTRTATRHFTYAEMLELENEIEGKPLHNEDRLKAAPGGVM